MFSLRLCCSDKGPQTPGKDQMSSWADRCTHSGPYLTWAKLELGSLVARVSVESKQLLKNKVLYHKIVIWLGFITMKLKKGGRTNIY